MVSKVLALFFVFYIFAITMCMAQDPAPNSTEGTTTAGQATAILSGTIALCAMAILKMFN